MSRVPVNTINYDVPITTRRLAKWVFQGTGCTHFHLMRDMPDRYREYQAFGISTATERKWTAEVIRNSLQTLLSGETPREDLWWIHSRVTHTLLEWKMENSLERLLKATIFIETRMLQIDRLLVAETIVGRNAVTCRSGLIYRCFDVGKQKLAVQFAELVKKLVQKPFRSTSNEQRRQQLLFEFAEVRTDCFDE